MQIGTLIYVKNPDNLGHCVGFGIRLNANEVATSVSSGNLAKFAAILRASSFVSNLALEGRQMSRVPSTLVKYDGGQIRSPITPSNRTALAIPLQFVQPNVDRRTHPAQ